MIETKENLIDPSETVFQLKTSRFIDLSKIGENPEVTIKVFNKDYVEANIFKSNNTYGITPVFLLGEDTKNFKMQLETLLQIEKTNNSQLKTKENEQKKFKENYDNIATSRAKSIKENLSSISSYITYNKLNFEKKLQEIQNVKLADLILNEVKIEKLKETLTTKSKPNIPRVNFDFMLPAFKDSVDNKCKKTILQTQSIKALQEDNNLAQWIEAGLPLHQKETSLVTKCLFCENELNTETIKHYQDHFNDQYKAFQKELDNELTTIDKHLQLIETWDKNLPYPERFYDSFTTEANTFLTNLRNCIKHVCSFLRKCQTQLLTKKTEKLFCEYSDCVLDLPSFDTDYIKQLNELIDKHNTFTLNLNSEKELAAKELELHYIAEVYIQYNDEKQKEQNCVSELIN